MEITAILCISDDNNDNMILVIDNCDFSFLSAVYTLLVQQTNCVIILARNILLSQVINIAHHNLKSAS